MRKHTPGPWKSRPFKTGAGNDILAIHSPVQVDGGVFEVCRAYLDNEPQEAIERIEADFRLIAAAPELLAALILVDETFVSDCIATNANVDLEYAAKLRNIARAAINKAKGTS